MRLFVAVPLPEAVQREASCMLERLRANGWPVRWVGDQGLHLTLKFFGDVTPDRCESIGELLDFAAADMAPMSMALGAGGAFPNWNRPRVIFARIDAGPDLELLQDRLERGGERLGFPPEGRPFQPHLTLGRVREGHRLPAGWQEEFERVVADDHPFLGDRVVLFESSPSSNGPAYSVRHERRLG